MRCDPVSAIDDPTDGCCKLDRCDLKRLAKGYRGKLHLSHIFGVMHDRSCLSRKIYPCFFQKSELFKIFVITVCSKPQAHLNKYRVAGVLGTFYKTLRTMSCSLCTVDPPVLHHLIARTEKTILC